MFSRPLEGTASFVINAGIYYDHEEWGTKISALYNVLGQRLILAPTSLFPAYYEMPRHVIDLTVMALQRLDVPGIQAWQLLHDGGQLYILTSSIE
jgi:hypothetical protein